LIDLCIVSLSIEFNIIGKIVMLMFIYVQKVFLWTLKVDRLLNSKTTGSSIIGLTVIIFMLTVNMYVASFFIPENTKGKLASETNETELNPVVLWNNLTTTIGLEEKLSPVELARAYALVHVSLYDSLLASNQRYQDNGARESSATAAGAASTILSYLFPNHDDQIKKVKEVYVNGTSKTLDNIDNDTRRIRERSENVEIVGKQIAEYVIHQISSNNSKLFNNTTPKGSCIWNGSNPLNPTAGTWKTSYLLQDRKFNHRILYYVDRKKTSNN
jgi:hypothetical protein